MFVIVLVVAGLLVVAAASAVAAYRLSGSSAWEREYNPQGMGLTIELAYLFLVVTAAMAISLIMADSFRMLFLVGAWRSPVLLASALVMTAGVAFYMLAVAPLTLGRKQHVAPERIGRECRLPYLMYAPFSIISWVGLVLPVLAVLVVSIHSDHGTMALTRQRLAEEGRAVIALSDSRPETAREHVAIYDLAYREAVDTVQRMVSRYLWVVGVFMIFVVVILNTRITSVFTEESQDAFKWLMWVLLAVAVGICLFGLTRYQSFRAIAIETHARLQSIAAARGQLELLAAVKEALLELRNQGPVEFLRRTVESGSLWLMLFGYALQFVMAKVTHRSVLKVIFPSPVARFLDSFMVAGEEPVA